MVRAEEHIRFRKSLVVLVIDDLTGKPVGADKVLVSIAGQRPPVVKPDGYRVFVNARETSFTLRCRSSVYYPWEEKVDLAERRPEDILVIRLKPNACYPVPDHVTCVAGQTCPEQRLWFWYPNSGNFRLMQDYKSSGKGHNNIIDIYHSERQEMEGRYFFISGTGKEGKEYFKISGRVDGKYRMDRELSGDYRKIGTVIVPVYEITADGRGEFFLPLAGNDKGIPEKEIRLACQAEGEQEEKTFTLLAGRINPITL